MEDCPYTGEMRRYAITPGVLRSGTGVAEVEQLVSRAAALAADGVEVLLLREKALGIGELAQLTQQVVAATTGSGLRIVVPDRVPGGVPGAVPAAAEIGVHVASGRFRVLKEHFPELWVSVSCHQLDEVRHAAAMGADAILFAPVFGKTVAGVEVVPAAGLERLRAACAAAGPVPVFALGGVTPVNARACLAAGAAGVAGIRMFFGPAE